ncbi:hypothetical protein ACFL20_05760 [Spirochaetota bacterium]
MIIPLDKLLIYDKNKYLLAKAAMAAIDKIGNINKYPEGPNKWKIVPNVLKLVLDDDIKIDLSKLGLEE